MKTSSPELLAYLAANNTAAIAELLTFTLLDGTVLQWTTGDTDLLSYSCAGPIISYEGGSLRQAAGSETSTIDILLAVSDDFRLPNGKRLPAAAAAGDFDGAEVDIDRLYMPTWGDTSLGVIHWFSGVVGPVKPASTGVIITVNGELERLNRVLPRRVFSSACPFALYDAACGLSKAYASGTVLAGATVLATPLSVASGVNYVLGSVEFLTGACAGQLRTIASVAVVSGHIVPSFNIPLPAVPGIGDTVRVLRGCDKKVETCTALGNVARFGGFPFVPKPESIR